MKNQLILFLMILPVVANFACRDNPTGPDNGDLHLSAEDIGVTDLYLRVRIDQNNESRTLTLTRDGQTLLSAQYSLLDTLILCDSLLPRHTYTYTAVLTGQNIYSTTYAELRVTTLDTTSHDFIWEVDTLGDGMNSFLKDVAIVNDTCVFAVGEIRIKDTTGNWDPTPYNVARWNGSRWTYSVGASVTINAVYAFSDTDVWVGTSAPYHFDGSAWRGYNVTGLFDGYVSKIWGTSSSNVYMVGTNGAIMHFNGNVWQKMESGTDVDLLDVWGSPDGRVVWACGWIDFKPTVLLRLMNGMWEKAFEDLFPFVFREDSLAGILTSIYTSDDRRLFVASGYGLYQCRSNTRGEGKRTSFTPDILPGLPNRVRGNNVNDMVMVGYYTMITHYNGITWKYFNQFKNDNEHLFSIDEKRAFVIAVGKIYDPIHSRGLVFRGRR